MHAALLGNLVGPDGLIIIVVLVVVLLFGGNKLPKLARGLGSASHEFRKGLDEGEAENKANATPKKDTAKTTDDEDKSSE